MRNLILMVFLTLFMGVISCAPRDISTDTDEVLIFRSIMVPANVVTGNPIETSNARAQAKVTLIGNSLKVSGTFENLSSPLRDIEDQPDNPGVHIHPGAAGEENSYIYGLQVELNEDERSGTFYGAFSLSDEEVSLLLDERLYLDIHTVNNDPGEVRGQIRPVDEDAVGARIHKLGIDPKSVSLLDLDMTPC